MVDSFDYQNGRIQVIRNDKTAFDTNLPSLQLFPLNKITLTGVVVYFPNMLSSIVYRHGAQVGGSSVCETWSGLLPQEWGPDYPDFSPTAVQFLANESAPPTRNLPRAVIGTVPAGTDFIDVRARITRTLSPPTFWRTSPPLVMFPENQWINLVGGSCTCEFFAPLIRHFDVRLVGTTLYLERYQSSRNTGQTTTSTGGNTNGVNSTQIGPEWGNYADAPAYWAAPSVFYEQRGPNGTGNKRPPWGSTSSDSCVVGPPVNYQSQYSADFIITPGRYS